MELDGFKAQIAKMFLVVALFSTFISLLIIFTFKDKPARPPGAMHTWSGQVERVYEASTRKALKALVSKRNYCIAMSSSSIVLLFICMVSTLTG